MQISAHQGRKASREENAKPKSPQARWAAAKLMMLPRSQVATPLTPHCPMAARPAIARTLTLAVPPCRQARAEARRQAQERKNSLPDTMSGLRTGSLSDINRAPPPCIPRMPHAH